MPGESLRQTERSLETPLREGEPGGDAFAGDDEAWLERRARLEEEDDAGRWLSFPQLLVVAAVLGALFWAALALALYAVVAG